MQSEIFLPGTSPIFILKDPKEVPAELVEVEEDELEPPSPRALLRTVRPPSGIRKAFKEPELMDPFNPLTLGCSVDPLAPPPEALDDLEKLLERFQTRRDRQPNLPILAR
ncbi:hypothetical protein AMTR_s00016p00215460 [Amborella trichopoda]|uniref:Uncharacterized protein n=1 Tax=Amborella trichopoda TaxID=13333 RepID=W1P8T2_AMBTC|nr:hypothetical protein AMTR_s00016p00215460 [Amborella trichopoda]